MRMPVLAAVLSIHLFRASVAGEDAAPSSHMVSEGGFEGDILINEVRVPAAGDGQERAHEPPARVLEAEA